MSRIIKLLNNETIEIVEYSKANACFQTNKYPNDELFCVIREQINSFDMFQEKLSLEQEIERLNNIINELEKDLNEAYNELHRGELVNGRELINNIYQELKELKDR